jgi:hypothetical protein
MPSVAATAEWSGLRPVANDVVQPVARTDFRRPVHAEDDFVREPVRDEVRHHREHEADDHPLPAAEQFPHDEEQRAHRAEEQCGLQDV